MGRKTDSRWFFCGYWDLLNPFTTLFVSIDLSERTDAKRCATFYVYSMDTEIQAVGQFFTPRDAFSPLFAFISRFLYTESIEM